MTTLKTYKAANTRKFKRLKCDYLIKYEVVGKEKENFVANLKDLSAGGIKFWTGRSLNENELLRFFIFVPPVDRIIKALGRVIRVRKAKKSDIFYGGIHFLELSNEDAEALNDFIEVIAGDPKTQELIDHQEIVKRRALAFIG